MITLSKQSETGSTITLAWQQVQNAEYYLFYADDKRVSTAPAFDKNGAPKTSIRFAKGGEPYEVVVVTRDAANMIGVDRGIYPAPPPPDPGWRNVINTDFAVDGVLPAPWDKYNFANGASLQAGYYLPSHVVVEGGICKLVQKYEPSGPARGGPYGTTGAGWYQGTIYANGPADSIDHRTTVRLRVVSTNGITSHRNLPLWWPVVDSAFPQGGEEDFFESDGVWWPRDANGKEEPRTFLHFGPDNSVTYWIWPRIDVSQWHTYRFQRLNHKITIWLDDMVNPVFERQYTATELPDYPKKPVFQQENPSYLPPQGTLGSEEIQIDSILIDVLA